MGFIFYQTSGVTDFSNWDWQSKLIYWLVVVLASMSLLWVLSYGAFAVYNAEGHTPRHRCEFQSGHLLKWVTAPENHAILPTPHAPQSRPYDPDATPPQQAMS